jgi:hypothetical protein
VALGTLSLGNRSVGNIKDDSPVVRSMGVVAGGAVRVCHRVIQMLPFKSELIRFMAFETQ